MAHGRSIRIYLADGSASGIRHAEVVNWTGQAIVCPRTRVAELKDWEESQRPGVYFLMGDDPNGSRPLVYVGEAENVYDRLKQHAKDEKKEFFDQVLLFTSKDANLTKAHVKYLESRIVELVRSVDRVTLFNGNTPPRPSLPRPDRAAMEEFLGPARLLMAALGFFALQALSKSASPKASADAGTTDGPSGPLANTVLHLTIPKRGVVATGLSTDEGFVVQKGSVGTKTVRKTLSKGWLAFRNELVEDGSITIEESSIRFERDVLFRSSSAAASVAAGGTWGGRVGWKDQSGRTLADLEEALLGSTEDGD
jgi:hypothetical protein